MDAIMTSAIPQQSITPMPARMGRESISFHNHLRYLKVDELEPNLFKEAKMRLSR
jgi:hypothetical protein